MGRKAADQGISQLNDPRTRRMIGAKSLLGDFVPERGGPGAATYPLASRAGLTRRSIILRQKSFAKRMDCRGTSAFTRVFRRAMPGNTADSEVEGNRPSYVPAPIPTRYHRAGAGDCETRLGDAACTISRGRA